MARPSHYHTTSGLTAMPSMPAFQRGHSVWGYPGPSGALTRKRKQPQGSPAGELVSLHLYTGGPVPPAFGSASVYPRKWDARASRACAEFFLNSRPPKHAHHQREKLIWERERHRTHAFCAPRTQVQKSERTQVLPFNLLCTLSSLTYRPSPHHCPPPHGFPLASGCVF